MLIERRLGKLSNWRYRPVAADRIWQKLTPKEATLHLFSSP